MAINNNFMSHALEYVLVSVLALIGAGFIVRMFFKRKNQGWRRRTVKTVDTDNSNDSTENFGETATTIRAVAPVEPTKPTEPADPIVELLRPKVESFSGNFSALCDIANDKELDTKYADGVFENVSNVIAVQYGDDVKIWYSSFAKDRKSWSVGLYNAKAAKLMELFIGCGVTPSDETDVVWSDVASRRYNRMMHVDNGVACEVVSPCWMLDGKLIEKGMVRRKG